MRIAAIGVFWLQVTAPPASAAAWTAPHAAVRQRRHRGAGTRLSERILPDYGKTSVEVDKIRLSKPKPKAKAETGQEGGATETTDGEGKGEGKGNEWRRKDLFGSSIVGETLKELENDEEFQATQSRLQSLGQEGMTKE